MIKRVTRTPWRIIQCYDSDGKLVGCAYNAYDLANHVNNIGYAGDITVDSNVKNAWSYSLEIADQKKHGTYKGG